MLVVPDYLSLYKNNIYYLELRETAKIMLKGIKTHETRINLYTGVTQGIIKIGCLRQLISSHMFVYFVSLLFYYFMFSHLRDCLAVLKFRGDYMIRFYCARFTFIHHTAHARCDERWSGHDSLQ